jgi:hypothetical protein
MCKQGSMPTRPGGCPPVSGVRWAAFNLGVLPPAQNLPSGRRQSQFQDGINEMG